jgi:hypothetical protein
MLFNKRGKGKTGYEYLVKSNLGAVAFKHKKDALAFKKLLTQSLAKIEAYITKIEYSDGYVISEEVV